MLRHLPKKGTATPSVCPVRVTKVTEIFGAVPPCDGPQSQGCTRNHVFLGVAVLLWREDSVCFVLGILILVEYIHAHFNVVPAHCSAASTPQCKLSTPR